MSTTLLIDAFSPFSSLTLHLPDSTPVSDVFEHLSDKYSAFPLHLASTLTLSTPTGIIVNDDQPLSSLHSVDVSSTTNLVTLRITPRILGGKGGFGSQLRAAGGRMSSQKTSNNDSCRDLNGRRLSTLKEAKKLAEYLESEPQRLAAKAEAQRAKLDALEKRLGIESGQSRKPGQTSVEVLAGKKHRFDDTEYLEQSRDLVDNVKSAVSVGLLKKRKKAKTSPSPEADKEKEAKGKEKEKEVEGEAKEVSEGTKTEPTMVAAAVPPICATPLEAVGA